MSGVVYFKFKSAISPDSVTFDGSFISVAELKNLIAARKGFGQDAGAELILTNPSTKDDYTNDAQQIPRQTTVHNCPNEGEYKRVRAPAGIPMTRLMENKDGGLYAPDGTLVSLKPNEDAFLREMAGLPTGTEQASAQAEEPKLAPPETSAAAAAGTSTAIVPITSAPTSIPLEAAKPLLLDNKPHSLGTEPQLAGEGMFSSTDLDFSLVPANKPFSENAMTAFLPFGPQDDWSPTPEDDHDRPPAQLPRGPKEFIAKAFERDEPLSQEDFEALQDAARSKYGYQPRSKPEEDNRSRSRSRSRSPDRSRRRRHHSRRRGISLDRGTERPERSSAREDRGRDRVESSRDRRSHRSSRRSRSPSRRREPERRRSSSRLPAAHIASRSSSHRQPDNRWTRNQERSSGGAVSPALSDDDGYQPFDRGTGGDRWQPPDMSNTNEVLIRPEPVQEDQPVEIDLPLPDVKIEQIQAIPEEESRPSERSRGDGERSSKRKRHHAEHAEPAASQHVPAGSVPASDAKLKLEAADEAVSPSKRVKKEPAAVIKAEPTGKLAGKTFTIPMEESGSRFVKKERSPSGQPTMPTSDIADASSQPGLVTGATAQGNSVKKSRAVFGMAMGAVLRPGTLPGVKPKRK
ncbi:hypothetical protein WJX79_007926 [Trebouxia sp. C0005]